MGKWSSLFNAVVLIWIFVLATSVILLVGDIIYERQQDAINLVCLQQPDAYTTIEHVKNCGVAERLFNTCGQPYMVWNNCNLTTIWEAAKTVR